MRVRSAREIASTLDEDGCLDVLPFMPEMAAFAGRTFQVQGSAHKTCDGAEGGMRRMETAVHLSDAHCDGSAHGGCQSRCLFFWKDAWLEPATPSHAYQRRPYPGDAPDCGQTPGRASEELARKAERSVFVRGRDPSRETYSCQSTEVRVATVPLPIWAPRQYWDDVRSGNVTIRALLHQVPRMGFNTYQLLSRRILPEWLWIRGGRTYPDTVGTRQSTPALDTGIMPGETVEIRSHAEILETLDTRGTNRGLPLSGDMVKHCGKRAIVHHRVSLRIDERTGELRRMRNPCLVLDGIVCQARLCPRALDHYWREIWLDRQEAGQA